MRISTIFTITTLLFTFLLSGSIKSAAQQATRDHDIRRDPSIMAPGFKAPQGKAAQASVITVGDYDNFKLGVDFAECSITVNPLDPKQMYVVWNRTYPVGGNGYYTVNGYDWIQSNPDWTGMMGDVVVVSDSAGRVIFENMYGTGGTNVFGAKTSTSGNFGKTWDPVSIALKGVDKNWIAADQTGGMYSNYIYTTMTFNGLGPGVHTVSSNQGSSYDSTFTFNTQTLPGMMVAVGPNDSVQGGSTYVVTNSGSSFSSTYTFYHSTDGGLTYTLKSAQNFSNYIGNNVGGRHSVQNTRTRPYPNIAVDNSYGPHRGRLYLVYASNAPAGSGNKPDIFCRYSDDGGTTWSNSLTVNDDTNSEANNNWFPAIWCDKKSGRLYISWMDTRDCPTSDSAMIYASYTDDGITFAPNQQVSNAKMKIDCPSCGGGGTPRYQGDYNGIGSTTRGSIMAWTDFRERTFGSYVGYFPDYALRAFPAKDSTAPMATFYVQVPGVKLYTDTVFVSASINAAADLFTVTYPEGKKIWQYPGQIPITIKSNAAPSGNYVLTITTTGSDGTPVHKRTTTVYAPPTPVAGFSASTTNPCEGNPVSFTDLSTGSPTAWTWSFPGGTPATDTVKNPTGIVYNVAGKYPVSLISANKAGSDTILLNDYITVKTTPPAPLAPGKAVCFGQPVPPLTATGDSLKWYFSDSLVGTGPTLNTGKTAAGEYKYTVTQSANGCTSLATPVTLTIKALPIVTLSKPDPVCSSLPAFNLSGGAPTGGIYSGKGVSNGLVFTPSVAGTGTHTITYTFINGNGCVDSSQQTITVKQTPIAPVAAGKAVCFGQPVPPLTATGDSIKWYFADSLVGTGQSLITGKTAAGVYKYTVTQSANGCESPSTAVSLSIYALPVVNLSKLDSVCISTAAFNLTGGTPAGGVYSGKGVTGGLTFNPSIAGQGKHLITYSYTDGKGCTDSSQQTITVNPLPVVSINPLPAVCLNAPPVKLSGTPAGGKFSGPGVSADTLYPSVAGTGSKLIVYTYTSAATGCQAGAEQTVKINPVPPVSIHDSTVCGNRKVVYDVTISNPGSYLWTPGGATTPKLQVDTVGKGLGAFTYQVKVTDVNGCSVSSSAKVTFFNCTGIDEMAGSRLIEVYPNPNKGQLAIRSKFIPKGKYDIIIFDVRGKPVYTEKSLSIEDEFLHTLDLGALSNGVYMLHIRNSNSEGFSKRFVINK